MSGYRDTMQVCMNGHVITDSYNRSPEFRKNFCTECGEITITQCPSCSINIPGEITYDDVVFFNPYTPSAPKICSNCGTKFLWFEKKTEEETQKKLKRKKAEQEKKREEEISKLERVNVNIGGHGNIVNLGSIADSVIKNAAKIQGGNDIKEALKELTAAVSSSEISGEKKGEYLEALNTLSDEALKPEQDRLPKSILSNIIKYGLGTMGAIASLAEIWSTWGGAISSFFLGV